MRFKNGLGLYSDALRARTRVTEAEQKVVSANKNFVLAKRSLGLLLGLEDPVDILEEIPDFAIRDMAYYTDRLPGSARPEGPEDPVGKRQKRDKAGGFGVLSHLECGRGLSAQRSPSGFRFLRRKLAAYGHPALGSF